MKGIKTGKGEVKPFLSVDGMNIYLKNTIDSNINQHFQ